MPTITLTGVVHRPLAKAAAVFKSSGVGVVHRPLARVPLLPGVYSIPVSIPAGALQLEDATYLLAEDGDYIEAE